MVDHGVLATTTMHARQIGFVVNCDNGNVCDKLLKETWRMGSSSERLCISL